MKTKFFKVLVVCLTLVVLIGAIPAGAIVPYTTYTYNVHGVMATSPHAYVPLCVINESSLKFSLTEKGGASDNAKQLYGDGKSFEGLDSPKDVFVDDLNNVYISNTGKNQIVVTDENYNIRLLISEFINQYGVPDGLKEPNGVFVTESEIYVADTGNARIVIFDKLGNFVDIIPEPESEVLPENSVYKPKAVAVDKAGRVYVVSSTTNYGVISLNRDGSFNGFIGPQKVTYNAFEYFLRLFKTAEQLAKEKKNVSTEFNNLTIDKDGFLYVTTDSIIDKPEVANAIRARSKTGDYALVKKLNPNGTDVMNRNGFWPPSGEVDFNVMETPKFKTVGPSKVVDVALGPNNTWSIIDNKRSRVFTYDSNGNLLYAFGDKGNSIGSISNLVAIDYQKTNMLLLDSGSAAVTVYKRTAYGDLVANAIQNTEDKNYEKAVEYYIGILQRNNNYDTAYVGIAQSMFRDGEYIQAMKYFKYAYDTEHYSEAYQAYRKEWMEKYIWVVPLVIFVVLFVLIKFFKFANKKNKKAQKKEKKSFGDEIVYGFHIITHPFDGFWDLKHEKRGSVRGATFWLVITALTFVYQSIGMGYLSNPYGVKTSYFLSAMSIVLPVMLWVTANWCLTTLFDGEGSFKDVYIATCYSLVPLPMLIIPCVMLSNIMTLGELDILSMINTFAFIWFGMLIFFGMMVTHDYTLGKNFLTAIGSIIGAAFIIFIAALFSALIAKVFTFFYNIYIELSYRWS